MYIYIHYILQYTPSTPPVLQDTDGLRGGLLSLLGFLHGGLKTRPHVGARELGFFHGKMMGRLEIYIDLYGVLILIYRD